jgi:hypothetical protein
MYFRDRHNELYIYTFRRLISLWSEIWAHKTSLTRHFWSKWLYQTRKVNVYVCLGYLFCLRDLVAFNCPNIQLQPCRLSTGEEMSCWVYYIADVLWHIMKNEKYHNVRTVPKSNRRIVERQNRYPKHTYTFTFLVWYSH